MTAMTEMTERLHLALQVTLDRFSVQVEHTCHHPVTGIFGASGAGKSSLLEAVAGLRRAEGEIRLGETCWLDTAQGIDRPPQGRAVGYVPQEGLLFPHWDVRRNLLAGAARARQRGEDPEARQREVVALLELEPLLHRRVTTLSGGERQRVALGRALCSGPRLLLLDEPLASLDLPLRRRLLPLLRRLRERLTVPMLLVSHDPVEVQALCDELLVLHQGQVIAHGDPRTVLTDPEVFPLAQREGFENLLEGWLSAADPGRRNARVRLTGGAGAVLTVAVPDVAPRGESVLVGVSATDILLATEPPRGLSARNVLPATVREIRDFEHHALVTAALEAGGPTLTVEVTEATPARLGLVPGAPVFLVVKATACRVYGGNGGNGGSGGSGGNGGNGGSGGTENHHG
jgi:molybdate transport system ATP-binding protein